MKIINYLNYFIKRNKFQPAQRLIIELGLIDAIDVSIYARPEFNWEQMEQIRQGLKKKLNVSLYAKPELTWKQMEEIRFKLLKD